MSNGQAAPGVTTETAAQPIALRVRNYKIRPLSSRFQSKSASLQNTPANPPMATPGTPFHLNVPANRAVRATADENR